MAHVLLNSSDQGIVEFKIWKSLMYKIRLLISICFILVGFIIQYLSYKILPGIVIILLGNLLLLPSGYTNRVNLGQFDPLSDWEKAEKRKLDELLSLDVPLPPHRPCVLVLRLVAPRLQLPEEHVDRLEQVERLEARDYDGEAVLLGQRLVFPVARDCANVPRRDEALHLIVRRGSDRLHGGGDQHVGGQHGEVVDAVPLRQEDGHGVGGGGGLEADGEEYEPLVGIVPRHLDSIQRRVDHAHVAPLRLDAEQVSLGAGDAQHVAEGGKYDLWTPGNGNCLVNQF